jgi:hypothetical protein
LNNSATEYLRLNGVDLDNASATVHTCDTDPGDTSLYCNAAVKRKLVRVEATSHVSFAFLPVIGLYGTDITASAVGEAATMDVVLVIDNSESMTKEGEKDPSICNAEDPYGNQDGTPGNCHPFQEVKVAAKSLAKFVLNKPVGEEEDRLALVVFSNGWQSEENKGTYILPFGGTPTWYKDQAAALAAIDSLQVYDPGWECSEDDINGNNPNPAVGPCRRYTFDTHEYQGLDCPLGWSTTYNDRSTCSTTDIGGGLKLGASMFGAQPNMEAVWVEILLTDGAANATCIDGPGNSINCTKMPDKDHDLPIDYCPDIERPAGDLTANDITIDGLLPPFKENNTSPPCRDRHVSTRHLNPTNSAYDADDYARNAADFAACDSQTPATACHGVLGQGAEMFAVGLGQEVETPDNDGVPYGDALLRYVATAGIDYTAADPNPCSTALVPYPSKGGDGKYHTYSCGNYFFSESGTDLLTIFDQIASRVFTRIAK